MKKLQLHSLYVSFLASLLLVSCGDNKAPQFDPDFKYNREIIATDVEMIYSDSAKLQFTIETPLLEKYYEENVEVQYFPKGILMKFYDNNEVITATMAAKYALRRGAKGSMLLQDSVVLINKDNDILISPKILWDEANQSLNTSQFVQLIRSSTKDTLYGNGFSASGDFSRFRINQVTGKRRYQNLTK